MEINSFFRNLRAISLRVVHITLLPNTRAMHLINDLASYAEMYKHLVEIAPAYSMKNKETDPGELNTKLLQNVEELTLNAIQQQKKIEEQNSKIEDPQHQKKIILQMQKRLDKLEVSQLKYWHFIL